MELKKAKEIAEAVVQRLLPYCERIAIAGSIRREKPEVKDIDIVCIPKMQEIQIQEPTLFGGTGESTMLVRNLKFISIVNEWVKIKGDITTCKQTQRRLPEDINLDIFITDETNWGYVLARYTGSAAYSKYLIRKSLQGGFTPNDGYLKQMGKVCKVHEEKDLFDMLHIDYVRPEKREIM